jgi:hypothetical protein
MLHQIKPFLASLNKWQIMVIILATAVIAWLLLQQYMFKPLCLNSMCPTLNSSLWPRIAFLVVCSAIAIWLFKTPQKSE